MNEQLHPAQQLKAGEQCECPTRKPLADLAERIDNGVIWNLLDQRARDLLCVAKASLKSPCPCEALRQERDEQYQRAQSLQASLLEQMLCAGDLKTQCDSLRSQVEAHQRWLTRDSRHAENQRLRSDLTASQERERVLREALTDINLQFQEPWSQRKAASALAATKE